MHLSTTDPQSSSFWSAAVLQRYKEALCPSHRLVGTPIASTGYRQILINANIVVGQ